MSLRKFIDMVTTLALITPILTSCAGQQEPANRIVSETLVLEKYIINDLYSKDRVISPNGRRVAYFGPNNTIVVDGIERKLNGSPVPYSLVFSPDSRHLAYTIQRDRKQIVVLDGIEGKAYSRYDTHLLPMPANLSGFYYRPVFSPDSQHLAYAAQPDEGYCVVLDGIEGERYFAVKYLVFSPDSKRFAYWGQNVESSMAGGAVDQKNFFVVDGVARSTLYPLGGIHGLSFTLDSQHMIFFIPTSLIVDGIETKLDYQVTFSPSEPALSSDGRQLAYRSFRKDESTGKMMEFVVVDGKPGKEYYGGANYVAIAYVALSLDSRHVAYTVYENQGKKGFVVVDGIEGRVYDSVSKLVFDSPNHLRYNALKGSSLYLVEETIK